MRNAYFFGYGSLVNTATHGFSDAQPARLTGWQREWRHTTRRKAAYLTVVPSPDSEIDGLIAPVPHLDWAALDAREAAYARVQAAHQIIHSLPHKPEIAVYAIPEDRHEAPTEAGPILLSYIDVVVQGYLQVFGEAGVERFFATTRGWTAPILDDRAAPRYSRHQRMHPDEIALTDTHLARLGAVPRAL